MALREKCWSAVPRPGGEGCVGLAQGRRASEGRRCVEQENRGSWAELGCPRSGVSLLWGVPALGCPLSGVSPLWGVPTLESHRSVSQQQQTRARESHSPCLARPAPWGWGWGGSRLAPSRGRSPPVSPACPCGAIPAPAASRSRRSRSSLSALSVFIARGCFWVSREVPVPGGAVQGPEGGCRCRVTPPTRGTAAGATILGLHPGDTGAELALGPAGPARASGDSRGWARLRGTQQGSMGLRRAPQGSLGVHGAL